VRVEDDIGFPGHPFAIGFILKEVTAETTDQTWQKKFVENAELVHKKAEIKGLTSFFNYTNKKNEVINSTIDKNDLKWFTKFAMQECENCKNNRLVLYPLNVQLLLILNKQLKKNNAPEINAVLSIGSSTNKERNFLGFNIEMEQIPIALKLIEYMGMYSQFKTGVLLEYKKDKTTKEERQEYGIIYHEFVNAIQKNESKIAEEKLKMLAKFENKLAVETIEKLRLAERLEINYREKVEDIKKKTDEKVKMMKGIKKSALSSMQSFFGSTSAKEKLKKAKEDVEKYKEELIKNQEQQVTQERKAIDKELNSMFSESNTNAEAPENYERLRFIFEISKFSVSLAQGYGKNAFMKMCELSIDSISVRLCLKIGRCIRDR